MMCGELHIFCHSDTVATSTANAALGLRREVREKKYKYNTQQRESERKPRERYCKNVCIVKMTRYVRRKEKRDYEYNNKIQ